MLNNLIESGSHAAALKRRGSFFILTLACYGVLLLLAGAASIYAYDSHLTAEEAEMVEFFFPPMLAPEPRVAAPRASRPTPDTPSPSRPQPVIRTVAYAPVTDPLHVPDSPSSERNIVPSVPPGVNYEIGLVNSPSVLHAPGVIGSPNSNAMDGSNTSNTTGARREPPPPPVIARPTPTLIAAVKKPLRVSTLLNGKALALPMPTYPVPARMARVTGVVGVQVVISETGKVVSAQAVSGSPLLRASAVRAALNARFAPTILNNQPVSVQGIINYNFKLE